MQDIKVVYDGNQHILNTYMKKLLILSLALLCSILLWGQKQNIKLTITASEWKNMYVWMWNVPKEYNETFIPMTQINDSVWSFTANVDLKDCKKAGLLFVENNSWNEDHRKTQDLKLQAACYKIPEKHAGKSLVLTPKGAKILITQYNCKPIDCAN